MLPEPIQPPATDSREAAPPVSKPNLVAIKICAFTVAAIPVLELIAAIIAGSVNRGVLLGFMFLVLVVILTAAASAGITTLVQATKIRNDVPQRALARKLGITAIVMAVVSAPINASIFLWFYTY